MHYKRSAVIFMMVWMLCGCTTSSEEGVASISPADSVQEDEIDQDVVQEEEQPEDGVMRDTPEAAAYTYYEQAVLDMENGEIVYRPDDYYHWVRSAAGTKEQLFVLVDSINEQENDYALIAIDRNGNVSGDDGEGQDPAKLMTQEIETFSSLNSSSLGYYLGKYYLIYRGWDEGRKKYGQYAYCYEQQEDGTFAKSQDTLCETIMELYDQGYSFCSREQDIFTCLNQQGLLLFWKEEEETVVAAFEADGTLCWEYPIDLSKCYIYGTDGRFVIGVAVNDALTEAASEHRYFSSDVYDYFIYDCTGTDAYSEPIAMKNSGEISIIGIYDGYVYYYYTERQGFNIDAYKVVRCCLDPMGEEELLYESADGPGLDVNIMHGIDGFAVQGDLCCFVNFDDGSLWWYSCNLADETHPLTRLGLLDDFRGMFDVGEVSYENIDFFCPKCGTVIDTYYAESICLSEEVVPHADVINQILLGNPDYCAEEMSQNYADYFAALDDEYDDDRHYGSGVYSVNFDGVTQYCFHKAGQEEELICLEVDYSVYEYGGGAHGYRTISHYFFDLADGSEITVGDIVRVSEEEFRTLAAEYTLADCQKDNSRYTYDENGYWNGRSLYDKVYEDTGFDSRVFFSEDGVVMEYAPYYLGGYAQGYIRVTIPYDELGLELLDIYGVKEER